jgi:hypothetical protein
MCWNEHVSLNTFIFSMFVLVMIKYNNEYSQYKIKDFSNNYMYFFFMSFICIQLVEHYLWKNLNDQKMNNIITKIGLFLILSQPFTSILTLDEGETRTKMLLIYGICAVVYYLYKFTDNTIHSTVAQSGQLSWNWNLHEYETIIFTVIYMVCMHYPMYQTKNYLILISSLFTFIATLYFYYRDHSSASMWCWTSNSLMLYYLMQLLYIMPYKEHGIC